MKAWKKGAIMGFVWSMINFFPEGLEGVIWPNRFPPFPIDIPTRVTHYLIGGWYYSWTKTVHGELTGRFDIVFVPILVILFVLLVGVAIGAGVGIVIEKKFGKPKEEYVEKKKVVKKRRFMTKTWMKGAILGFIFGLMGDIFFLIADKMDLSTNTFFGKIISYTLGLIFGLPLMAAVYLGFQFTSAFIGAILIWILIGTVVGYIYSIYRGREPK